MPTNNNIAEQEEGRSVQIWGSVGVPVVKPGQTMVMYEGGQRYEIPVGGVQSGGFGQPDVIEVRETRRQS